MSPFPVYLLGTWGGRVDRETSSSLISQSTNIDCVLLGPWFGKNERILQLAWSLSLKSPDFSGMYQVSTPDETGQDIISL